MKSFLIILFIFFIFDNLGFSGGTKEYDIKNSWAIRNIEMALGSPIKQATNSERPNIAVVRKSLTAKVGIKKEPGFLYFVDKKGNIARAPMVRGRKAKKKRKRKR